MAAINTATARAQVLKWANSINDASTQRMLDAVDKKQMPSWSLFMVWALKNMGKIMKYGGAEGLAVKVVLCKLDTDGSGSVNESELEAAQDLAARSVDAAANLCMNWGVVAALVLSMLLPVTFEDLVINEEIVQNCTEEWLDFLKHLHMGGLLFAITLSGVTVIDASRSHMMLTQWFSTLHQQLEYMEIVGLVGLQAEGNISIWSCLGFGVLRAFLVYGDFALYWGLIVAVTMLSFALVDSRRGCLSQILIYRDIELVFMQDQAKKKDQPAEAQVSST
mmetsp:Transcript_28193/g.65171  ORF Transcript_28193/g.65171 Transcript_28193/m.65171 type:complete len:278 (-) Transcript_28193:138-971(-)